MRRHESLRTRFAWVDKRPVALIASASEIGSSLVVEDLAVDATGNKSRQGATAQEGQAASRARSLDTIRLDACAAVPHAPLAARPDDHILLLILHHIIVDGWSIGIFLDEVSELYSAFAAVSKRSCRSQAFSLPISRAGSVAGPLASGAAREFAYWKECLRGASPIFPPRGSRCAAELARCS